MKLVSIDIETTGLNYGQEFVHPCQILEFAAVCFDPQPSLVNEDGSANKGGDRRWTTFEALVSHTSICGEAYALSMHNEILLELAGRKKPLRGMPIYKGEVELVREFGVWLAEQGFNSDNKAFIVGKNFAKFDDRFLEKIPGWSRLPFQRRMLDPGSLCFNPADGGILNLQRCLEKVGIRKDVGHRALEDALDVATVVSRFFA